MIVARSLKAITNICTMKLVGSAGLCENLFPVVKFGEGSADKLDADVQHKGTSCEGDIIPEVKDVHLHSHRHRHSTFRSALEP